MRNTRPHTPDSRLAIFLSRICGRRDAVRRGGIRVIARCQSEHQTKIGR
jgi:hypothetical protein